MYYEYISTAICFLYITKIIFFSIALALKIDLNHDW